MDLVSTSVLPVGSIIWQLRPSMWMMTVVCKATYQLQPIEAPLAEWQEGLNQADGYLNDDPRRSVRAPSDFAPFKIRADVVLVGNAFAPSRTPVRSLVARMVVGAIDKSIEVSCDRLFTQEGRLREAPPFANMPLVYERAAGGPETRNPLGMRADARDTYGQLPIPNLQPPGMLISSPTDYVEPIGFGPIAASWPERKERLGRHAATFDPDQIAESLVPDDIDPLYFNVAPRDQKLDALRENERLVLENLHPTHARLITSLPGVRPRAFLEGRAGGVQNLAMRPDLLWIDTDRSICTMTWRAQISLQGRQEQGRVVVALEQPGQTVTWAEVRSVVGAPIFAENTAPAPETTGGDTLVHTTAPAEPRAMPFAPSAPASGRRDALSAGEKERARTGLTLPFAQPNAPQPPPSSPVATPQPMMAPPPMVAPPMVAQPPVVSPPPAYRAPPVDSSPWASGGASMPSPVEGMMGQGLGRAMPSPEGARAERIAHASQAALAGVVAASDAAALAPSAPAAGSSSAASTPSAARALPREYIELLWFDDKAPQRVRGQARWTEALRALRTQDSEWITAEEAAEPIQDVKDHRTLIRAMTRVTPVDGDGVSLALAESIDEEGLLTRPLVVVTGELQLLFEELETLKATIAVVSPLLGADKKLSELVTAANETASSSWRCTNAVADGMTTRLKEAFAQANRSLPLTYVDSNVERILLDQRSYQKRVILGSPRLRASLVPAGEGGASKGVGIPTYLPERLERELPMFQRFRATVIAEAQSSQDQFESHPSALVVIALGRVLAVPGRGR